MCHILYAYVHAYIYITIDLTHTYALSHVLHTSKYTHLSPCE